MRTPQPGVGGRVDAFRAIHVTNRNANYRTCAVAIEPPSLKSSDGCLIEQRMPNALEGLDALDGAVRPDVQCECAAAREMMRLGLCRILRRRSIDGALGRRMCNERRDQSCKNDVADGATLHRPNETQDQRPRPRARVAASRSN